PQSIERLVSVREQVEVVADVEGAIATALKRAQHLGHVEKSYLGFGNRRDLHADVKLQNAEQQEQEAVGANEAGLKCGLLDFTLRIHAVAGEHVPHIVKHHGLGRAVLLAGEREAVSAVV